MAKGTIKKLPSSRDFGFIKPDDGGPDVFFHFSLLRGVDPQEGQRVEFDIEKGEKGPRARNLKIMADAYRFLNPYNFVRPLQQPRLEDHVLGNCPPPPHDRYVGLTGRITCKVEAVTPLFISDSHGVKEQDKHKTYRFFQYDGQPAVPASSLRGMIRSVFEAITNSCYAVFQRDEPYPLEYRGSRAPKLIPARVVELDENNARLELLDCTLNPPVVISDGPSVVRAAAVRESYPPRVLDSRRGHPQTFDPRKSRLPENAYDGMRVAALVTKTPNVHSSGRFRAFHAISVVPADQHQSLTEDDQHDKVFGWLHLTGPNIENKHDERLFFRWDDRQPAPPQAQQIPNSCLLCCTADVVKEYNHHLRGYWDRLQSVVSKLEDQRWPNSTDGVPHPSTFVEKDRNLRVGDLVYVNHEQGTVTMLRPVSMPRVRYRYSRQELLPDHLHFCQNYDTLCPACRVFGWVQGRKRETNPYENQNGPTAYAGRVRLLHGRLTRNEGELPETTLAILSTPKPTTTSFYLLNRQGQPNPTVTYDTGDARLRGRKIYRRHHSVNPSEYKSHDQSDQNRTIQGALKAGTTFVFSVDFENLAPLELGALLYALELESEMVHRLGYAKPLGFGSVKVTVMRAKTIDWEKRLQSLDPNVGWRPIGTEGVAKLKRDFLQKIRDLYGDEFNEVLADLRALLGTRPGLPIHYPRPTRHPDQQQHPQYEWFVGNNRRRTAHEGSNKRGLPSPVALGLAKDAEDCLPMIEKDGRDGRG